MTCEFFYGIKKQELHFGTSKFDFMISCYHFISTNFTQNMPLVKLSWLAFEFYLTLLSYLLVSLFYNLQAVYKERKFIKKVRMNIVTDYILRSYARLLCTSILYYVFWFCRCETAVYFDQCIQALCGFWAGWDPWTHHHPRTCTHFMRSFLWASESYCAIFCISFRFYLC